jgi:hypothetical protein
MQGSLHAVVSCSGRFVIAFSFRHTQSKIWAAGNAKSAQVAINRLHGPGISVLIDHEHVVHTQLDAYAAPLAPFVKYLK